MMRDLSQKDQLDSLLCEWHIWQKGYSPVPTCGADPMFRNAKSSGRHWDSTADVLDNELHGSTMETIDCQVQELPDVPIQQPYRSAIYVIARNLHIGANVWGHPRLPTDSLERGIVVMEARNMLMRRLVAAGVM